MDLSEAVRPPQTKEKPMLRGVATVNYFADDVVAARTWYAELLGIGPYFERPDSASPAYIEFRIGDYLDELGIIDSRYSPSRPAPAPNGTITYWHVDDLSGAYEKLLSMGATAHDKPTERGSGFITASVIDPFGNILGVMYNPHYLEVLRDFTSSAHE